MFESIDRRMPPARVPSLKLILRSIGSGELINGICNLCGILTISSKTVYIYTPPFAENCLQVLTGNPFESKSIFPYNLPLAVRVYKVS